MNAHDEPAELLRCREAQSDLAEPPPRGFRHGDPRAAGANPAEPTEIVGYGELKQDFEDRDAVLIGASTDTAHVHFAWRRSDEQLAQADFPWIADNKKELADALGIVDRNEGVAFRATFIIDPDNVIQHVTVNGLNVGRNPAEALRVLDALQTDELCPCNWTPGEEVLKPAA